MSVSSNTLNDKFRNLLLEEEPCYEEIVSLMDDEDFPTTRVLLVVADPNPSLLMKNFKEQFPYQVTCYEKGQDIIAFLKEKRHKIDLVLWDYDMPKINGLDEALKPIYKEMDLPVVYLSRDHKKDPVKKWSRLYCALDFLVKPVSKEVTSVLWRYIKSSVGESVRSDSGSLIRQDNDVCLSKEEGSKNLEDSVEQNTTDQLGDKPSYKKRRMSWTPELHHIFVVAVENLTRVEKVYPKHILKYMQEELNVEVKGLTRSNVASHLQKYRLNAEKKDQRYQDFGRLKTHQRFLSRL